MPQRVPGGLNRFIEPLNWRQIEVLRKMTGEQRLLRALEMIATVWRITADAIRNQNPGISEEELKTRLRERRS
ncbi:MAG: hypothetical protein ABIK44_02970 [candidate division WOR-3 bacterium]